jgi:hypothetical protein
MPNATCMQRGDWRARRPAVSSTRNQRAASPQLFLNGSDGFRRGGKRDIPSMLPLHHASSPPFSQRFPPIKTSHSSLAPPQSPPWFFPAHLDENDALPCHNLCHARPQRPWQSGTSTCIPTRAATFPGRRTCGAHRA